MEIHQAAVSKDADIAANNNAQTIISSTNYNNKAIKNLLQSKKYCH